VIFRVDKSYKRQSSAARSGSQPPKTLLRHPSGARRQPLRARRAGGVPSAASAVWTGTLGWITGEHQGFARGEGLGVTRWRKLEGFSIPMLAGSIEDTHSTPASAPLQTSWNNTAPSDKSWKEQYHPNNGLQRHSPLAVGQKFPSRDRWAHTDLEPTRRRGRFPSGRTGFPSPFGG